MKKLIPYLIIYKQCEKALGFCRECFLMEKSPFSRNILKRNMMSLTNLKIKLPTQNLKPTKSIFTHRTDLTDKRRTLATSVNFSDQSEQKETFEKLKVGGQITMGFSKTSANSTFATLIDKFGIHWYLNYENVE